MDQTQSSQTIDIRSSIIFVLALLLVLIATILAVLDAKIGIVSMIYSAAALCLIFASLPHFKSFDIFGVKAELNEVKEVQRAQSDDIGLVQVLSFVGMVSKYEINHLLGLAAKESYDVTYSQDLKNELKRLDDFGFVRPNKNMGLNTIDENFGQDINKYEARDKTKFNLKDYVHITDYGRKYIELANKLNLPKRF